MRRRPQVRRTVLACAAITLAACASGEVRVHALESGLVAGLAHDGAVARLTVRLTSDPQVHEGTFGRVVVARATVLDVEARGRRALTATPVVLLGDLEWREVRFGSRVDLLGRLLPDDSPGSDGVAALVRAVGPPRVREPPGVVLRGAEHVRAGIRDAVAHRPAVEAALVPALVDGDDGGLPGEVVEDFRTAGLTHLTAVSGTNLTLVVGFLVVCARWLGVRGRGLYAVGAVGIVAFVLLARTEPSVVRAAAMGAVGLVGLGRNGRHRGLRAAGVAACLLLLADPWLARSVGFALSLLATLGILVLAPAWRDGLVRRRWPRLLAEAVAVPAAAQVACTPLVAGISGQVSLVAVAANLLVAPVVAPATVAGLLGGVLDLAWADGGRLLGTVAGWSAGWIVSVAGHAAAVPGAAVGWPTSPEGLALLSLLCLLLALAPTALGDHGRERRRRLPGRWVCGCVVLLVVALVAAPAGARLSWLGGGDWPPRGWLLVACDVGQGDALVLAAGGGRAVVVDAGPDPAAVGACLDDLGVREVPLVVLTHFHADHVDGLPGVLAGRDVGRIEVSDVPVPGYGVRAVAGWARGDSVPVRTARLGETGRSGDLRWQVLGPLGVGGDDEASTANDGSVVLLVTTHGVRLLLAGDVEPEAQRALAALAPQLRVDVLKVPHHGSRYQDGAWLAGLGATLAVVSVGADNDYGHPAPSTLGLLRRAGMLVGRTDRDGDVAVVLRDGVLGLVRHG